MIGEEHPVYGLRPRGILEGEKFHYTVEDMASEYIEEIKRIQPEGPYIIGGECLGGSVAYEIAAQLRRNGETVSSLILLDAFRMSRSFEIKFRIGFNLRFLKNNLKEVAGLGFNSAAKEKSLLSKIQRLRKTFLPIKDSEKEFSRLELGTLKYAALLVKYRPARYDGKVILIVNEQWNSLDPSLQWDSIICPDMTVRVVPGDHVTRLQNPGPVLKQALLENLD